MSDVRGVPLSKLEDPIREALQGWAEYAEETVSFDIDSAARLELTPTKPNSARSVSKIQFLGQTVGDLYVIVFAPGDGSGDEKTFKLPDIAQTGPYPREARVVPRSKAAIHTEAHLTIASQQLDSPNSDPVLFAGSLDLITLKNSPEGNILYKLGSLGFSSDGFEEHVGDENVYWSRSATATVGYRDLTDTLGLQHNLLSFNTASDERFGDPHAVYNATPHLQVCAFLGISPELISQGDGSMLVGELNVRVPHLLDSDGLPLAEEL